MPISRKRRFVEVHSDVEEPGHENARRKTSPRSSIILDSQKVTATERTAPKNSIVHNEISGGDTSSASDSSSVSPSSDSDSDSSTPSIVAGHDSRPNATSNAPPKGFSPSTSSSPSPISPSRPFPRFDPDAFVAAHTAAEEQLFPQLRAISGLGTSNISADYTESAETESSTSQPPPAPSLLSRLTSFLPRLAAANKILEEEEKQGRLKEREIDVASASEESENEITLPRLLQTTAGREESEHSANQDDSEEEAGEDSMSDSRLSKDEQQKVFIEMNLGLGVLEAQQSNSDTSSTSSSPSDVESAEVLDHEGVRLESTTAAKKVKRKSDAMGKLMDVHGKRKGVSNSQRPKVVKGTAKSAALIEEVG